MSIDAENLNNIIEDILKKSMAKAGVTQVEAGTSVDKGISVTVRNQEVETVEFNRDKSVGITIYKGKAKGSVSTTDISAKAIDNAIEHACQIASITQEDSYSGLADKNLLAKEIKDLDLNHPSNILTDEIINIAKECEKAALEYSDKIINSEGASMATNEHYRVYGNSNGFIGGCPSTRYSLFCSVIAKSSKGMQRDYDYTVSRNINNLLEAKIVGELAAKNTVARLDGVKIKTTKAPVIFLADIAKGLLGGFIAAISGGNLYRKSSFLLDSINTKIFPEYITIDERPHLEQYLGSAPFDNDGVLTREKTFIENGILRSYVLGTYSARRLGLETTANAGGVYNLHAMAKNSLNFDELVKKMGTGLIVTELMGHGANIVTGDYSRGAAGFWVENGVIQYPVEEVTIAGNLKDMFSNVVSIADDYDYRGNCITGSWLLDEMTIAGA